MIGVANIAKKILHVLSSGQINGAENVAIRMIANLCNRYDFAYTSLDGPIRETLLDHGIAFLPMRELSIKNIKQNIIRWKPDIIHSHDFTTTVMSVFTGLNIPVVAHIHQNPEWLKRINLRTLIFLIVCCRVTCLIVVSKAIQESAFLMRLYKKKIKVIENIADINFIQTQANFQHNQLYDIAFVGRLVNVKNPLRFINIVDRVIKINPAIKVVIIGDGILKKQCELEVEKKQLKNNITFLGHVNNPYPIIKNSRVIVMTSKNEGLPMVLIEAMALGKPLIVPQIEGLKQFIDKNFGTICESDDEYINAINNILDNKDLQDNMSINAKERAKHLFNMEKYCNKVIDIYETII